MGSDGMSNRTRDKNDKTYTVLHNSKSIPRLIRLQTVKSITDKLLSVIKPEIPKKNCEGIYSGIRSKKDFLLE